MKRVFSGFDLQAVYHARNLLEAEGIRCVVKNELLSSAAGELPPAECQIELWVLRDEDAAQAERLSRLGRPPDAGAQAWRCTQCGESLEAQFTHCWRCAAPRP